MSAHEPDEFDWLMFRSGALFDQAAMLCEGQADAIQSAMPPAWSKVGTHLIDAANSLRLASEAWRQAFTN